MDERGEFTMSMRERPEGKVVFAKPGYAERQLQMPAGTERIEVTLVRSQNDAGLIRQVVKISLSHSLTLVQKLEPAFLQRPLDDAAYREFIRRHGEEPPEDVVVRVYLPAGVARICGVLLISEHGIGGPVMEHRMFREFADRHELALVGVLGDPIQRGIYPARARVIAGRSCREHSAS